MTLVCEIGGPFLDEDVSDQHRLADEEENGEEEEERLPDLARWSQPGVSGNAPIPKARPSKKDDKTPQGIKEGKEEKADRFTPIQGSAKHPHHFPSSVKVDEAEEKPEDEAKSCEGIDDRLGIRIRHFPAGIEKPAGDDEDEKEDWKIRPVKVREIQSTRWSVGDRAHLGSGVGIIVTQVRGRNRDLPLSGWDESYH